MLTYAPGRRSARALRTVAPLLAAACWSHRPFVAGDAPPHATVRVHLASPRALRPVTRAGDTFTVAGVWNVLERVVAVRGDTLDLEVQAFEPAARAAAAVAGARLRAVAEPGARVEVRGFSGGKSAALLVGLAGVLVLALWGLFTLGMRGAAA